MTEQQTAAMQQALSKIKAARDCHPNAVQTLIFEAEELLESTLEQQPSDEPVAWGNLANWCLDSDRVLITDKTEAEKYHRDVYDLTALYTRPQPASAPPEAQTEAEKTAYAFGWWKAMEYVRQNGVITDTPPQQKDTP